MNKKIALMTSIASILVATPSWAFFKAEDGDLTSFISSFAEQWQEIKSRLEDPESLIVWVGQELLNEQPTEIEGKESGELGLPDVGVLRKSVEEELTKLEEPAAADETASHLDREVTRAKSQGTLSKKGQEAVSERIKTTSKSVEKVNQEAEAIQQEQVTQKVLKRIALQNVQQAEITGAVQTEMLDLSVKQDLANNQLTNISEGVDSQNLSRQAQTDAGTLSTLQISAMTGLF
jgi:hypothetical protein